ncbi:phosphatase [Streptomyces lichenis]|uniref:Phosphatase n=1 Tax=Streptomyces lichenis TaxID=2306967 RepID=A0ABT0IIQ3_9ACTN|nr:phosphatase [Streptomyces lichenis]MCK8681135.1 phosphatase [Streptomyces lichenis]
MLTTEELRARLLADGLAGRVSATRAGCLRSYRLFADRDPRVTLGLVPAGRWDRGDVLRLMAERCGVSADPAYREGPETIDPERTLAALEAFAVRLRQAVERREAVLFGTGHPHRLLPFYGELADALSAAGCPVLTPAQGRCVDITTRFGVRTHTLDYVRGVALVRVAGEERTRGAPGAHSHSPLPVRAVLEAAADAGGRLPELVVGDHGWVCGAGQLGIAAIGLADADDPAVFVAEAEGRVAVAVPLDDGMPTAAYRPPARRVLQHAGLAR